VLRAKNTPRNSQISFGRPISQDSFNSIKVAQEKLALQATNIKTMMRTQFLQLMSDEQAVEEDFEKSLTYLQEIGNVRKTWMIEPNSCDNIGINVTRLSEEDNLKPKYNDWHLSECPELQT